MDVRQAIIEEALSWVGTPYHHKARVKGVGVDCAQLVGMIAYNVGLVGDDFLEDMPQDYSDEWNLHNTEEKMINFMLERGCTEVSFPNPGDIIAFKIGRAYGHLGILIGDQQFVHAMLQGSEQGSKSGEVVRVYLNGEWKRRKQRYFRFPTL